MMENAGTTLLLAFVSILANVSKIFGMLTINQTFTIVLSILSIIYLVFGIFIRAMDLRKKLKSKKDDLRNISPEKVQGNN